MEKKNYKKFLIELFENQLNFNQIDEEYLDGHYYPSVKFPSDLDNEGGEYKYSFLKDCSMILLDKIEHFYISFNSIKTEISFMEFKRLSALVSKKQFKEKERFNFETKKKDEKLLNDVFSAFAQKQKRKILIEKTTVNPEKA